MSKYPVEQITLPILHFMLMNVEADVIKTGWRLICGTSTHVRVKEQTFSHDEFMPLSKKSN